MGLGRVVSLHSIPKQIAHNNCEHKVFEILLSVVARLVTSCKEMRSIILYPMIGEVGHSFRNLFCGTNKYDFPNEQNLYLGNTASFNDMEEVA